MLKLKKRPAYLVWGIVAIVLFAVGIITQMCTSKKTINYGAFHGTLLDHSRKMPLFDLMGTDHQPFNLERLQGRWTFLFFGFTHCGSICPVTMAELGKMFRLLAQGGVQPKPQVFMVTLDPERDNPARLEQYVKAFDPSFEGVYGSLQAVQKFAHDMGIASERVASNLEQPRQYNIEHSGAIMLINPHGELVAFFTPPHQAALLASDYKLLNTL